MLRFPPTAPTSLVSELANLSQSAAIEDNFKRIMVATKTVFGAKEAVGCLQLGSQQKELFSSSSKALERTWSDSKTHRQVYLDLKEKLAPVSYSNHSWPYLSNEIESLSVTYSIIFPFSSQLIVTRDGDTSFFGYGVVFFEEFPQLDDSLIQLIITLPELYSNIIATILRDSRVGLFSHDVKRFLLFIKELLDPLKTERGTKRKEALTNLESSLHRMLLQTEQVLLSEKNKSGELAIRPVKMSLSKMVEDIAKELNSIFKTANLGLVVDCEQNLPSINLDPALFPSVIHNLLENAKKFSQPEGEITIRTALAGSNAVIVEVLDEGLGIPEGEEAKVFDQHYRGSNVTEVSGSGFGLYITKTIVEAHGGFISVDRDDSGRTCFTVKIPL